MKLPLDRKPLVRRGWVCALLIVGLLPAWARAQGLQEEVPPTPDTPVWSEPFTVERSESRRTREVFQLGGKVEIARHEEVRDVVVIFGDVRIGGRVQGDVVVVFGRATIDGEVRGSVVLPFSSLELGPASRIGRDLVIVLGELTAHATSQVVGQRIDLSMTLLEERLPAFDGAKQWVTQGLLWVRPLPHQAGWWWGFAFACAALYFLTALIFRRPLSLSVDALEKRPVAAFFLGLLVLVLTGPLLLMLTATGIGLIVVPFVVTALLVAFLFGKISVYQFLGRELGRQLGLRMLTIPLVALLIGIAVFYLVYMVPVLGLLAWFLSGLLGLGAASVAFFSAFRAETASGSVAPAAYAGPGVPVAEYRVGSAEPPEGPAMAPSVAPEVKPEAKPPEVRMVEAEVPPPIPGQKPVPGWLDAASLPRVGFWSRFGATLIDLLLIGLLVLWSQHVSWFIPVWVTYHVAMWAWRGTTIGGIVFNLRVAKLDGRPVDFPIALVRSLSSFLSALALFVGFFWAGWTREKRAWHDLIANTMIVRLPRGASLL
jgi:uncharacterized RDD family membrane protein YckC